jgi:hypothetical protein
MLLKTFINDRRIKNTEDPGSLKPIMAENEALIGVSQFEFRFSLIIVVLGLVYVGVIPYLGYLVATMIAVFFLTWVMGNRNRVYIFILSVIVPLIIYKTFLAVLYVPVPRGLMDLIGF